MREIYVKIAANNELRCIKIQSAINKDQDLVKFLAYEWNKRKMLRDSMLFYAQNCAFYNDVLDILLHEVSTDGSVISVVSESGEIRNTSD